MNHECPNCGALASERVHVEWYRDMVEDIRLCEECPAQFTVTYADPQVELDLVAEENQ